MLCIRQHKPDKRPRYLLSLWRYFITCMHSSSNEDMKRFSDLTCRVQCVREQGPLSHISASNALLLLFTNKQTPHLFILHLTSHLPLFMTRPHFPPSTSPIFSTPFSSLVISITQLNIYLSTSAWGCNFASLPSLYVFVFSGCIICWTKTGRHAGEGLTSSILP